MKKKLYVLMTVDTENPQTPLIKGLYNHNLLKGEINKKYFGYPKIIELCNKYKYQAVFFFDVYEREKFGKEIIRDAKEMIARNHDIQLHIHPVWKYDRLSLKRESMYEYNLEEQKRIIRWGKEEFRKILGKYPIAARCGIYSINKNTFLALKENNIAIDSSNFYGYPHCKEVITKNKIVEKYGIIEIPITVFWRKICLKKGLFKISCSKSIIKTDIDCTTLDELKFFVRKAKKYNIKVMNLFMHSYSFIKFNKNFTQFRPDYNDIKKFEGFLKFIKKDKNIQVITMKEFYDLYKENPNWFIGSNYIPTYLKYITLNQVIKFLFQKIKSKIRFFIKESDFRFYNNFMILLKNKYFNSSK